MPRQSPSIACRYCGCRLNDVTDSHKHEVMYLGHKKTIIKRYRKCKHCGLQFTTVETYEDEENSRLPEGITPFKPAPEGTGISGVYKPAIPKADTLGDEPAVPPMRRSRRETPTSPSPENAKRSKRKK